MRTVAFLFLALLLAGCMTIRKQTFEGRNYDSVYRSTVRAMCAQDDFIVYGADKERGNIKILTRGLSHRELVVQVLKSPEGVPEVSIFAEPAMVDRILLAVTEQMAAEKGKSGKAKKAVSEEKESPAEKRLKK